MPALRRELDALRPVVDSFVSWPADVLRPSLRSRSASPDGSRRKRAQTTVPPPRATGASRSGKKWRRGFFCKLLATDAERHRSACWCASRPASSTRPTPTPGVEELHLLDGELWIDERKLYPGDYNRAEAAAADTRVWSETGCTCVLITSTKDLLR